MVYSRIFLPHTGRTLGTVLRLTSLNDKRGDSHCSKLVHSTPAIRPRLCPTGSSKHRSQSWRAPGRCPPAIAMTSGCPSLSGRVVAVEVRFRFLAPRRIRAIVETKRLADVRCHFDLLWPCKTDHGVASSPYNHRRKGVTEWPTMIVHHLPPPWVESCRIDLQRTGVNTTKASAIYSQKPAL